MILDKLLDSTRTRVRAKKEEVTPAQLIKKLDKMQMSKPMFKNALLACDDVSVIAEIKKASPSKGLIREDFDHMEIADAYKKAQVQALSVLTEPEYFKGSLSFVSDIKAKYDIPILRKDFTVDEYQLYEAKAAGADAVLLIMAALSDKEYAGFLRLAADLGLDALVETHSEEEVRRACAEEGGIIGINNRDLQTFNEDITTCQRLGVLIPDGFVRVAESAVRTHEDFEYLRSLGFDAALIGEAFMREKDVGAAVDKLRRGALK